MYLNFANYRDHSRLPQGLNETIAWQIRLFIFRSQHESLRVQVSVLTLIYMQIDNDNYDMSYLKRSDILTIFDTNFNSVSGASFDRFMVGWFKEPANRARMVQDDIARDWLPAIFLMYINIDVARDFHLCSSSDGKRDSSFDLLRVSFLCY